MNHYPTDYLLVSFNVGSVPYRIRFKVIQRSQFEKTQVVFTGTPVFGIGIKTREKKARHNRIFVSTLLTRSLFFTVVKEAIIQRYQLREEDQKSLTLKFEKDNKIRFVEE